MRFLIQINGECVADIGTCRGNYNIFSTFSCFYEENMLILQPHSCLVEHCSLNSCQKDGDAEVYGLLFLNRNRQISRS